MTDKNTRLFPPYLLWFVLLPALPFLLSISALSFFVDPIQAAHEYVDKTATLKKSPVAKNLAIDPKCSDKSPENCISGQYFIENIFSGNFTYEENPQKILAHIADVSGVLKLSSEWRPERVS